MPSWPIRRRQRSGAWPVDQTVDPNATPQPRATVETIRGQRQIEAACNIAAARGVVPGQPLSQARAICRDLLTSDAEPAADLVGLIALARWCERISPLTSPDPPDGLWIDITGCAHLQGGEQRLATLLQHRLSPCRIAIADTAGAAWALARAATRNMVEIAAEGRHGERIASFPPSLLRLDARVVAGLQRVGLRSVDMLQHIPRAELTTRFGPSPSLQLDRALGLQPEPIIWLRSPCPWQQHQLFAEPISTPDALSHALAVLASELAARLEAAGLGGIRFRARFIRVDDQTPDITLATARPLHSAARLTRLLTDKLDQIDPGFGVEAMQIEALEVASLKPHQPSLDAAPPPEDLLDLLDTLTNRLGPNRLWRPRPVASHVPERASSSAPVAEAQSWPPPPGPRPIRLLTPPEPIDATAPVPDDPPVMFRWRGALHRVRAASGPERISDEWWRRSESSAEERFRDYYYVENRLGGRFWLFRTGLPGGTRPVRWYLHGLFG